MVYRSEVVRYADPATDFPVYRLTDPSHTSLLPYYYSRALSRRSTGLLYATDRSGSFQACWMNLKTGQSRQLTDMPDLLPRALALSPDERWCCGLAGRSLWQIHLDGRRTRTVYSIPEGFEAGDGFSLSDDGQHAAIIEKSPKHSRVRLIPLGKGSPTTVIESPEPLSEPTPRPRRAGLLYRQGAGDLHVVNFDGEQNQTLRLTPGGVGPALWSQDGRTVDYLNFPDARGKLNSLYEFTPDANQNRLVSPTSQFVHFGRNGDGSVFVGASGSKASPYLSLLVAAVRRELTLCEHKASNAELVAPIFSPDSQRVFFQTDRHGKPAIYSMHIEKLVSETE